MAFKAITTLDKAFEVGIILKAVDGALEILGGLLLLLIKPSAIGNLAANLTQAELSENPHDVIASHILHAAQGLTHGALLFGAIYLLVHGLIKVVLVSEILRDRLWAYPGLIVVTAGFMLYQIYQISYSHSLLLIFLTLFDGLVIYLTTREYAGRRHRLHSPRSPD